MILPRRAAWVTSGTLLAVVALPAGSRPSPRSSTTADTVTFARHVAPILQQKCQTCHRPGSIAPMPLLSYDDAVKAAPYLKLRVGGRTMPPWHIDKTVGIRDFKNDRSLSEEQVNTIVRWVDAGTPFGDAKDLPPPVQWKDEAAWGLADRFGGPDLVVRSTPYTVPASGQDKWWRPLVETGVTEPRWVRAMEIRPSLPGGRKTVHHVLTLLEQHEQGITGLASTAEHSGAPMSAGLFMEWAVGKTGEIFPEDAGKLILPGAKIRWEVHYYTVGEQLPDDVVELGVWFYPKGFVPKHRTVLQMFNAAPGSELDIPPGKVAMTQNFYPLRAPARLENFQPHMHMRGKAMAMEAIYPTGRRELLSMVSNFQWRWHVNYIYADGAAPLLPAGTVLVFTAWHDNTAANPNNPDPRQWVGWGDRTVDEMAHAWVDVTYLEQDEFARLVAARKGTKERAP